MTTNAHVAERGASPADAEHVARLVNEIEHANIGMNVYTVASLLAEWEAHGEELAANARLLEAGGELAAYLGMTPDADGRELFFEGYVAPAWTGRGLGTRLVNLAEDAAHVLAAEVGAPVVASTNVGTPAGRALMEAHGYDLTEHERAMFLDLDGPRPRVPTPEGVAIRRFIEGRDERLMWDVMRGGFGSDWEGPDDPEKWIEKHTDNEWYDPHLWFFAADEHGEVGAVQARTHWHVQTDTGWLKNLAVVERARRRGVGRALLLHAAALFHDRGKKLMVLGTFASNPTNALQFYLRVGMRLGAESFDLAKTIAP